MSHITSRDENYPSGQMGIKEVYSAPFGREAPLDRQQTVVDTTISAALPCGVTTFGLADLTRTNWRRLESGASMGVRIALLANRSGLVSLRGL